VSTAPKEYKKNCTRCNVEYVGIKVSKYCDLCMAIRAREKCRKPGSVPEDVERICSECEGLYMGPKKSKLCLPCSSRRLREANRIRKAEAWQAFKALKVGSVGSKLPPACQRCQHCYETDQHPSGMECLVAAFLRCQPWAPNAKPLKEREDVST